MKITSNTNMTSISGTILISDSVVVELRLLSKLPKDITHLRMPHEGRADCSRHLDPERADRLIRRKIGREQNYPVGPDTHDCCAQSRCTPKPQVWRPPDPTPS